MFRIKEFLEDYNVPYTEDTKNVSKDWINIQCPFPTCPDHSNHCGINPDGYAFSCWMCGESGGIARLISAIVGCSAEESKKIARKYYEGRYKKSIEVKPERQLVIPEGLSKKFPKSAIDYLHRRRFNPDIVIEKYNLYWGGLDNYFKYRIVFPIIINRRIVTYVGRDITGKAKIPYKNWPNKWSSSTVKNSVFNIDSVTDKKAIVVEGIFDALRIGDGCISLLGKTFTKEQIELILSKKLDSIFIMFDSKEKDSEIETNINKFKNALIGFIPNIEILELDKGDPGDLSAQEVINLRKDTLL